MFSTDELLACPGWRRTRPTGSSTSRSPRRSSSRPRPATGSGTRWSARAGVHQMSRTGEVDAHGARSPSGSAGSAGPPARLAHLFINAGLASRARSPMSSRPSRPPARWAAYRDALTLIDAVREHAGAAELPQLLARRGDLLQAIGDPERWRPTRRRLSVTSGTVHRLVQARLARAASPHRRPRHRPRCPRRPVPRRRPRRLPRSCWPRAMLAYFDGDLERAWEVAEPRARAVGVAGRPVAPGGHRPAPGADRPPAG